MKLSIQHMCTLAWLGLFAMLMIFIAPSISTHLAKNSMDNSEMTGMSMSAEHAGHRTMMSQNLADSPPAGHNMADMSTGDCFNFCGYSACFITARHWSFCRQHSRRSIFNARHPLFKIFFTLLSPLPFRLIKPGRHLSSSLILLNISKSHTLFYWVGLIAPK